MYTTKKISIISFERNTHLLTYDYNVTNPPSMPLAATAFSLETAHGVAWNFIKFMGT